MKNTNNESGAILLNVLLIIMLVVIGGLVYLLMDNDDATTTSPRGQDAITIAVDGVAKKTPDAQPVGDGAFTDGLGRAARTQTYELDEFGAGIASVAIFEYDINNDGAPDRITRTRHENGTAHFYDEYKIELNNNNKYTDITPDGFRTTEGGECALQKLRFVFSPNFQIIKVSRPWESSWDTPSIATQTIYSIENNRLNISNQREIGTVCDVAELLK